MGNGETDTPTKTPKPSSTQEQPPPCSPAAVFPDWASFQAYYNSAGTPPIPPPPYFHSSMASSPQAHPYMWGQHMMPPYGTPPPYVTMYPHGGMYPHPSMPPGSHPYSPYAMLSSNGTAEAFAGKESESKSGDGKKKTALKRSKGSLGSLNMLTGKGNDMEKASGAYSGGTSQSGESLDEGSSEGSGTNSRNLSEKASADAEVQNRDTTCGVTSAATQIPPTQAMVNHGMVLAVPPNSVSGPTTNLNIGMDYWGGPTPSPVTTSRAKLPTVSLSTAIVPSSLVGSHDGVPSEIWMQDERELKRQRRKQSNRESARRSRLRKQAEYDELARRVDTLNEENNRLKEELGHIQEECKKLASENATLNENLQNHDNSRANGGEDQAECTSQVTTNRDSMERES